MSQPTESEQVIWSGSPTQWLGAGWYALLVIMIVGLGWVHYRWQPWPMGYTLAGAALLMVPMLIVWAGLKTTHYQLSSERLRSYHGILLRHVDELELYRVRDTAVVEPIVLRLLGCGHVC
ncbi:MAG: PH domain-containing protein [Phycisphaerales bacterium]|nr:PH domain-containing protein [Phycisphaerales bacterium]